MIETQDNVVPLPPASTEHESHASRAAKEYFTGVKALQDLDRLGRLLRTDLKLARNAIGTLNRSMVGLSVDSTDDLINLHGTANAALILLLTTAAAQHPEVEHHIHGEDPDLEEHFRDLLKATV